MPRGNRYPPEKENKWIQPIRKGYGLACCDCGLVHELDFRIHKRHIQLRARRKPRSTGQVRRWMKRNGWKPEHLGVLLKRRG